MAQVVILQLSGQLWVVVQLIGPSLLCCSCYKLQSLTCSSDSDVRMHEQMPP